MKKLKPYHTSVSGAKKYVRFADGTVKTFSKEKVHAVEALGKKAVSAGFFVKKGGKVRVFGHSDSLQLKPKAGDASKIK